MYFIDLYNCLLQVNWQDLLVEDDTFAELAAVNVRICICDLVICLYNLY